MIEFFETYGADILAMFVALSGSMTSIVSLIKAFKINKSTKDISAQTDEKIKITQEGIVEAFKTAKLPTEWKISVSNQVDAKLEAWAEKFLTMFKEHEDLRTQLALANTKILAYTAAFNKLDDEDKEQILEVIKEITDKDKIIEV